VVRADELGILVLAAFEGALILSRTYRDLAPLDTVHRELRELVQAEPAKSASTPNEVNPATRASLSVRAL
jgi:hypothetical protein